MLRPLALALLLAAPARSAPATAAELRDLTTTVDASAPEFAAAARNIAVARARHAREREEILAQQLDAVARIYELVDGDPSLQLMPHEVARLRAERAALEATLDAAGDEARALSGRLSQASRDAVEQPWTAKRRLEPLSLRAAAKARALPGARDGSDARVDAELARIARAEHRIDELQDAVLPELHDALDSAVIDLADGGAMLDVLEALERTADARLTLSELQQERELALVRLQLLCGAAPLPEGHTAELETAP